MSSAKELYQLQEIDLKILRNLKRLKEIDLIIADNKVIQLAQNAVNKAENALKPLQTKNKKLGLEIQSNTTKSKATEQRLYSGNVKNPKELQEMQQEISAIKNRNEELEELLLEVMVSIEEAETLLNEKQSHLQSVTQEWESQHTHLIQEQDQLETENSTLSTERTTFAQTISPEDLKTYEDLRTKKANKPISRMEGRSCTVCGIQLTLAVEQEVRRGHMLINCTNCGRILVDIR